MSLAGAALRLTLMRDALITSYSNSTAFLSNRVVHCFVLSASRTSQSLFLSLSTGSGSMNVRASARTKILKSVSTP